MAKVLMAVLFLAFLLVNVSGIEWYHKCKVKADCAPYFPNIEHYDCTPEGECYCDCVCPKKGMNAPDEMEWYHKCNVTADCAQYFPGVSNYKCSDGACSCKCSCT